MEPEKRDFWDSFGAAPAGPSKEKQDFWNSFGDASEGKPSSVGTAAMRKGPNGGVSSSSKAAAKGGEDEWNDDW